MKNSILSRIKFGVFIALAMMLGSCQNDDDVLENNDQDDYVIESRTSPIKGQYIIVLKDNYAGKSVRQKLSYDPEMVLLKKVIYSLFSNIKLSIDDLKQTYSFALDGFTATLSDEQVGLLQKDSRIKSIEQDYLISLGKPNKPKGGGKPNPPQPPQEMPWGIIRVGGGLNATGKTAWIIDTGVDTNHPDLVVDVARSRNFVTKGKKTIEDGHGHGTHVSGTVAAVDNEIGVVGVAAGATIVALRVLDNRGSGQFSWVIAALDYVAANANIGDAANMSLGPGSRFIHTALDDASINVASQGIKLAIAAGNSSDDAIFYSPARANHANIHTVSAMDINDVFASFSNYGSPVDAAAPGVGVKSTFKDGTYRILSGTSMSAPHVCGLFLLGVINADGFVINDPDGNPDPIAHN